MSHYGWKMYLYLPSLIRLKYIYQIQETNEKHKWGTNIYFLFDSQDRKEYTLSLTSKLWKLITLHLTNESQLLQTKTNDKHEQ
jgi:hypothetical protein